MALTSTKNQWETFLKAAGIPDAESSTYADTFVAQRISIRSISEFDRAEFNELGITVIGDVKNILLHAKSSNTNNTATAATIQAPTMKAPAAPLPRIEAEMTNSQFREFRIEWTMFKQSVRLQDDQIHSYLYNCCDSQVQNALVNSNKEFATLSEEALLKLLESLVTKTSNPSVHQVHFYATYQQEKEPIRRFLERLQEISPDCSFSCYSCKIDLQEQHLRCQFIRGLGNETLQTDILAKASQLKTLEDVVKHAEGFEAAQRDQSQLQTNPEVFGIRSSMYKQKKNQKGPRKCPGCGSTEHGQWNSNDRSEKCPAWGKECNQCGIPNHFGTVCRKKDQAGVHGIHQESVTTANSSVDTNDGAQVAAISANPPVSPRGEILTELSLKLPRYNKEFAPISLYTFPDSGSDILVGGPQHLAKFNLNIDVLIPPGQVNTFKTSSGERVDLIGWLPAKIKVGNNTTTQPFYVSRSVDRIYLSRYALMDLNILPPTYPLPMDHNPTVAAVATELTPTHTQASLTTREATVPSHRGKHPKTDELPDRGIR